MMVEVYSETFIYVIPEPVLLLWFILIAIGRPLSVANELPLDFPPVLFYFVQF